MKTTEFVDRMLKINRTKDQEAMRKYRIAMKEWRRSKAPAVEIIKKRGPNGVKRTRKKQTRRGDPACLQRAAKALAEAGAVWGIALGEDAQDREED